METNWLDIMPAIPLARSVPVVRPDYGRCIALNAATLTSTADVDTGGWDAPTFGPENTERVDLEDPQGFAYALNYAHGRASLPHQKEILYRWLNGQTTDADRLALARALAELEA